MNCVFILKNIYCVGKKNESLFKIFINPNDEWRSKEKRGNVWTLECCVCVVQECNSFFVIFVPGLSQLNELDRGVNSET